MTPVLVSIAVGAAAGLVLAFLLLRIGEQFDSNLIGI